MTQSTYIISYHDTAFLAERINSSCTPPGVRLNYIRKESTPNAMTTPSPTVTLMDDSSPKEKSTTTLVWVLVSVTGLVTFLFIVVVAGLTYFIICKKTKKQQRAEFAKSRSAI